jgi:succinyl-CoA synthetase beta subunit
MKLFEYQAKELFETQGIPIPRYKLIQDRSELEAAIDEVGSPCAIKAQVLHGSRGKAGLIQLASGIDEAREKVDDILLRAQNMRHLLIEEAIDIDKELYVSITAEPVSGSAMVMACAEGGIDIEEIAKTMPDQIIKTSVNLSEGLMPFQARNIMYELRIDKKLVGKGAKILVDLFNVFREYDAELVEINPLMVTKEGTFVAGDGKVNIDDNSLFKHNQFTVTREHFDSDVQYEASREGIPYLQFDGDIGLMCAGAGLTNTVFDLINDYGGKVANYLEFGGPNYRKAVKALTLMMKNDIKVLLVITFGTIARADVIAQGLVEAIKKLKPDFPIVTAIRGTGEEEAQRLLRSIGLEPLDNTEEAVGKAIELAGGGTH